MKNGYSVFVGNIDFDVPEQKVVEELGAVGKVVSFRMMYDRSTGRSKGYGFCEYESPLIAETAMKTLKISFNGRPVKINYAENDVSQKMRDQSVSKPMQTESILNVLDNLDQNNLKEVIEYLKKMAVNQPMQLKDILDKTPSPVFSILTVLVKLNLVDKKEIAEIVNSSFDVKKQKDQIAERISSTNEQELNDFPEEVKARMVALKQILTKK